MVKTNKRNIKSKIDKTDKSEEVQDTEEVVKKQPKPKVSKRHLDVSEKMKGQESKKESKGKATQKPEQEEPQGMGRDFEEGSSRAQSFSNFDFEDEHSIRNKRQSQSSQLGNVEMESEEEESSYLGSKNKKDKDIKKNRENLGFYDRSKMSDE